MRTQLVGGGTLHRPITPADLRIKVELRHTTRGDTCVRAAGKMNTGVPRAPLR